MLEIKTFANLLAFQDIGKKKSIMKYFNEDMQKELLSYLSSYDQKTDQEIHDGSLLEIREIISRNFIKIYDSMHPSWLEEFFRYESRETISVILKFVPLEMSGAILEVFPEEQRNEIMQRIPDSVVSREVMEILKFCIAREYGYSSHEAVHMVQNDQLTGFILNSNIDLSDFFSFIYSYEVFSYINYMKSTFKDTEQDLVAVSDPETEKQVKWFDSNVKGIRFDPEIFIHSYAFRFGIDKGYLLIPYIRVFTYLNSKNLLERVLQRLSYRLKKDMGTDFMNFCSINLSMTNPVNPEANAMRISECIYYYRLYSGEV